MDANWRTIACPRLPPNGFNWPSRWGKMAGVCLTTSTRKEHQPFCASGSLLPSCGRCGRSTMSGDPTEPCAGSISASYCHRLSGWLQPMTRTRGSARRMNWTCDKTHVSETCDEQAPHLVTHVETTRATTQDNEALDTIHQALEARDLLPSQHIVDSGYMSADLLARSQTEYGIDLVGPLRPNVSWQAQEEQAFDISHFHIDWATQQVTCPAGQVSHAWTEQVGFRGSPVITVPFRQRVCRPCPLRA